MLCASCETEEKPHYTERGDGPYCIKCIGEHDHTLCKAPTYDDNCNERGFCSWCAVYDHKRCGNPRSREWFIENCMCCQRTMYYLETGQIPPEVKAEAEAEEAAAKAKSDADALKSETLDLVPDTCPAPAMQEVGDTGEYSDDEEAVEVLETTYEVFDPAQDCLIDIDVWAVYMTEQDKEPEFYDLYEDVDGKAGRCWNEGVPLYFRPSLAFVQAWVVGDQAEINDILQREGHMGNGTTSNAR